MSFLTGQLGGIEVDWAQALKASLAGLVAFFMVGGTLFLLSINSLKRASFIFKGWILSGRFPPALDPVGLLFFTALWDCRSVSGTCFSTGRCRVGGRPGGALRAGPVDAGGPPSRAHRHSDGQEPDIRVAQHVPGDIACLDGCHGHCTRPLLPKKICGG